MHNTLNEKDLISWQRIHNDDDDDDILFMLSNIIKHMQCTIL